MNGQCECGCGGLAPLAKYSHARRGYVEGQPMRFIANHHRRKSPLEWLAKDMGYKTPCWVWQRAHSSNGYARACVGNAQTRDAHLVYYEKYKGPIPEGLELDHLCRVTL